MNQINYTGSSKLIQRIVDLLNRKAPMPLDGQGNNDWGTDGQVLSTDGSGHTSWVNQSGGGSSGHVIQDNGTDMTARAKLDFVGATVTDDAVNDATVVTINGKTYTMTISGHTITLTDSDGTAQTVTVPDNDTTYSLSISGTTLTLTDSDGNHDDVTLPDNNTTYTLTVSGTTVTLTGSDGSVQTITTQDTTYSDATQSTSGLMSATDKTKLDGIASGAEVNVQADWNEADSSSDAYIQNKPTIPVGSDYVQKAGDTMTGNLNVPAIHVTGGRAYDPASGDDYGVVVNRASNSMACVTLGNPSAERSSIIFKAGVPQSTFWRFFINNTACDIEHPKKSGVVALVSDIHTMWDRVKTAMTKRANLWFADASVSDVSADDATKVEVVTELASENAFDALATDGTADGVYCFPDSGGMYLDASMVAYDGTSSGLSATDVQGAIDDLRMKKDTRTFNLNTSGISYVNPKYILLVATDNTNTATSTRVPVRLNSSYLKVYDYTTNSFLSGASVEFDCYYYT